MGDSAPLTKRQCIPCVKDGGDLRLLGHETVAEKMQDLDPLWVLDDGGAVRMIWRDRFQPSLSVLPTQLHKSALLACASGNQPQIRRQKLSGLPFPALCSCYQIQLQSVHDTCTRIAHCQSALDYIAAVGAVAEQSGHHPDLHLTEYRTIEVRLSTHARGGITINDFIVAAV